MRKPSYQNGEFCWADLGTTDIAAAKAFYGELFGWALVEIATDGMPYTMAKKGDADVAALYTMPADEAAAVPSHWNVYAAVTDVDEVAGRVAGLGGKVTAGPFDVSEYGRLALVRDPAGGVLCLWQGKGLPGAGVWAEPGALCWCELWTQDPTAARAFYTGLLGWGAKVSPEYTEWEIGGASAGGMFTMGAGMEQVPPHWTIYFQVDDCDQIVERAVRLGGRVLMPPRDQAKVGRFATLADPTGASFCVIQLT